MFARIKLQSLNDFFKKQDERRPEGIYFCRINGFCDEVGQFLRKYYEAARSTGVILEGKIQNPDEKNLSYYSEIMGMDFVMRVEFFESSLQKWLPRMNHVQRKSVAGALFDTLDSLRKSGKTEAMQKNAYIKFMCWLYYKFERIVNRLGQNVVPKILYEAQIGSYELMLFSILSKAGCDIVLLQPHGDDGYRKLDPGEQLSQALSLPNMGPFPEGFGLKRIREDIQSEAEKERLYGKRPELLNCTNAWMQSEKSETVPDGFKKSAAQRGSDPKLFYNCYCRIYGVWDKLAYANDLYRFQMELKNSGRAVVIVSDGIARPTIDEISAIHRNHYEKRDQMILDLSVNIKYTANPELQRLMVKSFVDVLLAESETVNTNLNKLTNKAVYLLCWLKRCQGRLFANRKGAEQIGCFLYLGGCRDENEALFLRFLARLPVDILILCPSASHKCCLKDSLLYEIHYEDTLDMRTFPQEGGDAHIGTAAYHAERELDVLMYQDTGRYRNQQYGKANAVILQTMYEEIQILWNEEVTYRPNFSTIDGTVSIPVIAAKVSGVKDGDFASYWRSIKELVTEDTFVVKKAPFIGPSDPNPMKAHAVEFYKNGRLQKEKIKNHPSYPYGFLREEMQDYILEKLQVLIEEKIIKGTFENGTEYTTIAVVLNLPKEIVRLIQKFDFTKKNPKFIYIHTTEEIISLEDTVLAAFLSTIGFDVLFFVPTGYRSIEKYFQKKMMEEHRIGTYVYDLCVPNLEAAWPSRSRLRDIIFKKK